MTVFAFVGFGELGSSLAEGLARSGAHELRAYTRGRDDSEAAAALAARLRRSGTRRCSTLEDALAGAAAVHAVVPGGASAAIAERSAPLLDAGAYYVDLSAAPVAEKQAAGARLTEAGARYVDGAVLGTVSMSGFAVPILASGPGAGGWQALVQPEGLNVESIDAPSGDATLIKLLRSVYMKGRDALIVEMMLAARRHGLEDRVTASIRGPGEQVPFPELADRVLRALAVHAERRGEELRHSGEIVRDAGVEPLMSRAGAEVLGGVAALGLRDTFGGERPASSSDVLDLLDQLTAGGNR